MKPFFTVVCLFTIAATLSAKEPEELFASGNRITFVGGTSIERLQDYNYLETLITSTYPDRKLHFRNLGWSGDDVFGTARAVFGKPSDGFKRLEKDLQLANPNVILVCYGANEAFAGVEKIPQFVEGLSRLFEMLEKTEAKIVLVSPSRLQNLGKPLPDPEKQNQRLKSYIEEMKKFAKERNVSFIDFYSPLGDSAVSNTSIPAIRDRLSDQGLHLNEYGHWRVAPRLAAKLGVHREPWDIQMDIKNQKIKGKGATLVDVGYESVSFTALDLCLPYCAPPAHSPKGARMLAPHDRLEIDGLAEGKWGLQIDGKPSVIATSQEWQEGVYINRGLYLDQSEKLREAIRQKNELFFHRYRPQNETYLFLFRKHEQGNNAVEIPEFDKLISEKEKEIDQLKKPVPRKYKLVFIEKPSDE